MKSTRIIIFAKTPLEGVAKTRLIPALGIEKTALLAQALVKFCVKEAVMTKVDNVELCVAPSATHFIWDKLNLPKTIELTEQGEGDLGERLSRASQQGLSKNERIILIGTDCPALTTDMLMKAISNLEHYDSVIIPAIDGGYTLLGLNKFSKSLFEAIPWSTEKVAKLTIERIHQLNWSLVQLATLPDIDEQKDLIYLPKHFSHIINDM